MLTSATVRVDTGQIRWIDTGVGDTYWSQYTSQTTGAAGAVVNAGDNAPTNDQRNLVAIELLSDD